MSRYIDADALIEDFESSDADGINLALDRYAINCIDDAPTADVVEVVRCKDCKHYISDGGALMICEVTEMNTSDCDFCSYGERKEE